MNGKNGGNYLKEHRPRISLGNESPVSSRVYEGKRGSHCIADEEMHDSTSESFNNDEFKVAFKLRE